MIVVTGGTGFLGAHLLGLLLLQGKPVKALRRATSLLTQCYRIIDLYVPASVREQLVEWYECDLLDTQGLAEVIESGDEVYHCAAEVGFEAGQHNQMNRVNVSGTANIVNTCIDKGAKKLCHVSSIGALGDGPAGTLVNEDTPRGMHRKSAGYSYSKYLAELEVFRGIAEGLDAVILNPSVILGPGGEAQGIGKLVSMVKKGLRFYPGGSNAWVDVRDVAQCMVMLMASQASGERFIISAENLSYQKILEYIALETKANAPGIKAGRRLLEMARLYMVLKGIVGLGKSSLSKDVVRISSSDFSCDASKFHQSHHHTFLTIRASIHETVHFPTAR